MKKLALLFASFFLVGCGSAQDDQKIEGVLKEVRYLNDHWVRLKFEENAVITLYNNGHPLYLGHHQAIFYRNTGGVPYVTNVVCSNYEIMRDFDPKTVVVLEDGNKIYCVDRETYKKKNACQSDP